jgi:predicted ATPase
VTNAERAVRTGAGFIREVALLHERVADFDLFPFPIAAVRHLGTLKLDPRCASG